MGITVSQSLSRETRNIWTNYMAYAQTPPLNNHYVGLIYISVSLSPHLHVSTLCKRTARVHNLAG